MAVDKSQKFISLVRLGFAARGVTYILLGMLALGTTGKAKKGATGAFEYLQDMPLGTPLLWLIAIGLLAYALFKLLSGAANLSHHSDDAKGAAKRVGDVASGIIHLFLAYAAYRLATGTSGGAGGNGAAMAQPVMGFTLGPVLIGIAGLGTLAAAGVQAKRALTGEFMEDIASDAPAAVEPVGRAGFAARAVVFVIIGWSLVKAAWMTQGAAVKGLGEVLLGLRNNGFVYTLVALGLLLFGAFSLVTARYRIIPDFERSELKPKLPG